MPQISQFSAFFPPAPKFTDKNLPSLKGKVYIVTGGASGVGYELAKILYVAGGTVYIAARSTPRCEGAIKKIKLETGASANKNGELKSMVVDLADMTTLKPAAEKFMREESRLDVLVHNAAVMTPPAGSKNKHVSNLICYLSCQADKDCRQGHDLEFGTNCLAPYVLTILLEPIISRTATASATQPLSVRIVWVVSLLQGGTLPGAMKFEKDGTPVILEKPFMGNYLQSKAGAAWLADEFSNRLGSKGVLSIVSRPEFEKTPIS
jgi:retinol dehydrogenase-12